MWWSNPREKLDVDLVWRQLQNSPVTSCNSLKLRLNSIGERIAKENIKITLEQLKLAGLVNETLLLCCIV
jgi:hypothetical protein